MSSLKIKLVLGSAAVVAGASFLLLAQLGAATPAPAQPQTAERTDVPTTIATATHAESPPAITRTAPQTKDSSAPQRSDEHKAALLTAINAGAPSTAPWTTRVKTVVEPLRASTRGRAGDLDCRTDGCVLVIDYPDELAQELGDEALTESEAFRTYDGWRHRSVQRDDTGHVVVTWFFMKP
jgi:hypothetical protein